MEDPQFTLSHKMSVHTAIVSLLSCKSGHSGYRIKDLLRPVTHRPASECREVLCGEELEDYGLTHGDAQ